MMEPLGIVNLDKPLGLTSNQAMTAVRTVLRRATGSKLKVGHAGTLDPEASGVLVLLVGRATKLTELLMDGGKGYRAEVTLGAVSTTDDNEGEIASTGAGPVNESAVRLACQRFVGRIEQRPPAHSAVHVGGRRAYELARSGELAELPARAVTIHAIELLSFNWPVATLSIDCGRGVYVRSIARDLGERLGVGGYLSALTRTRVGPFRADDAVALDACREDNVPEWVLPIEAAAGSLRRVDLSASQARIIATGKEVEVYWSAPQGYKATNENGPRGRTAGGEQDARIAVFAGDRLIALCEQRDAVLHPRQVIRPT
jgi:tRNA pseudouridine55 synthase